MNSGTMRRRAGTAIRNWLAAPITAILALAARNATECGFSNVETHLADAEDLTLAEADFDAAGCRLEVMFLPDPLAGLSGLHRALRFCSKVFAGPDQNPCPRILMSTASRHAGLPPRDRFTRGGLVSLGRPADIETEFAKAVATTQTASPFPGPATQD